MTAYINLDMLHRHTVLMPIAHEEYLSEDLSDFDGYLQFVHKLRSKPPQTFRAPFPLSAHFKPYPQSQNILTRDAMVGFYLL